MGGSSAALAIALAVTLSIVPGCFTRMSSGKQIPQRDFGDLQEEADRVAVDYEFHCVGGAGPTNCPISESHLEEVFRSSGLFERVGRGWGTESLHIALVVRQWSRPGWWLLYDMLAISALLLPPLYGRWDYTVLAIVTRPADGRDDDEAAIELEARLDELGMSEVELWGRAGASVLQSYFYTDYVSGWWSLFIPVGPPGSDEELRRQMEQSLIENMLLNFLVDLQRDAADRLDELLG